MPKCRDFLKKKRRSSFGKTASVYMQKLSAVRASNFMLYFFILMLTALPLYCTMASAFLSKPSALLFALLIQITLNVLLVSIPSNAPSRLPMVSVLAASL